LLELGAINGFVLVHVRRQVLHLFDVYREARQCQAIAHWRQRSLFSFDLGSAHFVIFSTEFYFSTEYGWNQIRNQWNWLIEDLTKANNNRAKVPWILTFGHRPMYCSDFDGDDCTKYESIIRTGLPKTHAYGLEKLFYEYAVDVEFWAHEHTYERMWPVYNRTVYNGTMSPYVNPLAPVHIVSGSAGCRENTDTFVTNPGPWSARRSTDYGFGMLRVHNATHIHFRQVADEVQDDFWIEKNPNHTYKHAHRRYVLLCSLNTCTSSHQTHLDGLTRQHMFR
uniref:Metallophos domain-containing protein n=1 Tax=Heligmosomoides polygyrus TaxID=6339 RepID=A0A183G8E0_HELPZ